MSKPLRILLVDDSKDDALLLLREIKKGDYEPTCVRVETAEAMARCLNEQTWDIVISDYLLPKFSAPEALKVSQKSGLDLPFIIVSGKVVDEVAVDTLTAGAHDFITKDNLSRLIPAINRELAEAITRAAHKKAQIALKDSESLLRTITANFPNYYISIIEEDLTISFTSGKEFVNQNIDPDNLVGITLDQIFGVHTPFVKEKYLKAFEGTELSFELLINKQYQKYNVVPLFDENGVVHRILSVIENITERKQTERNQTILADILKNLNSNTSLTDTINSIITIIKRDIGFDAVGIRLQDGEDFPYFIHNGFSNDFLISENTLLVSGKNGEICRDKDGNAFLECTCGLVISGKTDPTNPLFTPGGSFWTNDSIPLLDFTTSEDPRLHPRNLCIRDGFCSVALIPIRTNQKIVGLLQFNDRKKDCFTLEMIRFFEQISTSIGVALMRKQFVDMLEKHTLELELNKKRLDALLILTNMADNSLDEIGDFVLDECIKLTNSEFGFIGFMNKDESILTNTAWTKSVLDICSVSDKTLIFPVAGAGIWAESIFQRKSVIINDYESSRYNKNGVPEGHVPILRLINVPLFESDRIIALAIMANKKEEYDENDLHQLALLLEGMWTIVQRKRAEEEIRTLNRELEQRVKDRTIELDQKNKELVRLDKVKSEFLDTVNHELRTPLTSIIGYSKLLLDGIQGKMNEKQTQYIERIWAKGNHQLQLVNDLLDFSKLESGNMDFRPKSVSVVAVINDVASDEMPLLKEKRQEVIVEIADGVVDVYVDEMRFEQILLNLVNNAVKFTPVNGKIIIRANNIDEMVKISVIDTGIGIKEADIQKLFHRFVQVDQSNSRSFCGTGLGLTIVKKLTELMGGYIDVESEYGNGSTFSIFLPQRESEKHNTAS